jgi:hypothetical protein
MSTDELPKAALHELLVYTTESPDKKIKWLPVKEPNRWI